MWAQMITVTLKPGAEDRIDELLDRLHRTERPGSGLIRSSAFRDQAEPSTLRLLVVFESEEKAREREADEGRNADLVPVRALMGEMFAGPPSFVDLGVVRDTAYGS
jgi:quinol monooxygenase YgiN